VQVKARCVMDWVSKREEVDGLTTVEVAEVKVEKIVCASEDDDEAVGSTKTKEDVLDLSTVDEEVTKLDEGEDMLVSISAIAAAAA